MENKIKAVIATILTLLFAALLTYAFVKEVQFLGVLLAAAAIMALAVGMYQTFYGYFENKSNNKQ